MMVLGVDTGLATCGWALLDAGTCSFVDLGVVCADRDDDVTLTLDRARRGWAQARILAAKGRGCGRLFTTWSIASRRTDAPR